MNEEHIKRLTRGIDALKYSIIAEMYLNPEYASQIVTQSLNILKPSEEYMDSTELYLLCVLTPDRVVGVSKKGIYHNYVDWSELCGFTPVSKEEFLTDVERLFEVEYKQTRQTLTGRREWLYVKKNQDGWY